MSESTTLEMTANQQENQKLATDDTGDMWEEFMKEAHDILHREIHLGIIDEATKRQLTRLISRANSVLPGFMDELTSELAYRFEVWTSLDDHLTLHDAREIAEALVAKRLRKRGSKNPDEPKRDLRPLEEVCEFIYEEFIPRVVIKALHATKRLKETYDNGYDRNNLYENIGGSVHSLLTKLAIRF